MSLALRCRLCKRPLWVVIILILFPFKFLSVSTDLQYLFTCSGSCLLMHYETEYNAPALLALEATLKKRGRWKKMSQWLTNISIWIILKYSWCIFFFWEFLLSSLIWIRKEGGDCTGQYVEVLSCVVVWQSCSPFFYFVSLIKFHCFLLNSTCLSPTSVWLPPIKFFCLLWSIKY